MTKSQYLEAGEKEMEKSNYEEVTQNPVVDVKTKVSSLVSEMKGKGEITDKIADYIMGGDTQVSKFYHLLKSHKIPTDIDDPTDWLVENGFPVRSIISSIGSPTGRLGGVCGAFITTR